MQMSGYVMHTAAWINQSICDQFSLPVDKVTAMTKDSGSGPAVN